MSAESHQPGKHLVLRAGLAVILALALFGAYRLFDMLYGPNEFTDAASKRFLVSRGQTFASVADSLESAGIIRNREYFVFAAKLYGGSDRIKVGKYEFPNGISNVDLFLALRE